MVHVDTFDKIRKWYNNHLEEYINKHSGEYLLIDDNPDESVKSNFKPTLFHKSLKESIDKHNLNMIPLNDTPIPPWIYYEHFFKTKRELNLYLKPYKGRFGYTHLCERIPKKLKF